MTDLRGYMSTEFFEDTRTIEELELAMHQIAQTFNKSYREGPKPWPYELRPGSSYPEGAQSQTTRAMILCSVIAMRDEWQKSGWPRASSGMLYANDFPLPKKIASELAKTGSFGESKISQTIQHLTDEWHDNAAKADGRITTSRTFGNDDPMSLGWALDLIRHSYDRQQDKERKNELLQLLKRILQRCSQNAEKLGQVAAGIKARAYQPQSLGRSIMNPRKGRQVGDSSYILARFAGVLRSILRDPLLLDELDQHHRASLERAKQVLLERFETRLHDHLSFAEIVDSRFDSTELAFCLAGMLLVQPDVVANAVFDRVMSVVRTVQDKGVHWRSETPMLYQYKGDVLFTVGVEAVNAILSSFAIFDGRWRLHDSVASRHIHLVKRYWRWLKARKSIVRINEDDLEGWHSEHVNDPTLIHLWETSQVAEFLVNFRDQLKRHVARTSLTLAACSYKQPIIPGAINKSPEQIRTPDQRWEAATEVFEPVTCLGDRYKAYDQIGKHFVTPRFSEKGTPDYSMLLFGPPGTGKTTVASALSWTLDYPLITITVSDFLADGHAAIETRAKDLFDMLKAQPRSVVLFDEIDQFMLDRDSEHFRDQETVFQFLTPGMLTKLNDLRASESVLFIMATNYAERIDAAIKRQGRIDQHLLLLPADKGRRKAFVEELWGAGTIDVDEAVKISVFLSYGDLKSVSTRYQGAKAIEQLKATPAAANPDLYRARFHDKSGNFVSESRRTPIVEFIAMVALEMDAEGKNRGTEPWQWGIQLGCERRFIGTKPPGLEKEIVRFVASTS
jgi:predicted component of type VI protein secretion system